MTKDTILEYLDRLSLFVYQHKTMEPDTRKLIFENCWHKGIKQFFAMQFLLQFPVHSTDYS